MVQWCRWQMQVPGLLTAFTKNRGLKDVDVGPLPFLMSAELVLGKHTRKQWQRNSRESTIQEFTLDITRTVLVLMKKNCFLSNAFVCTNLWNYWNDDETSAEECRPEGQKKKTRFHLRVKKVLEWVGRILALMLCCYQSVKKTESYKIKSPFFSQLLFPI